MQVEGVYLILCIVRCEVLYVRVRRNEHLHHDDEARLNYGVVLEEEEGAGAGRMYMHT
jgi:hypothetical protein